MEAVINEHNQVLSGVVNKEVDMLINAIIEDNCTQVFGMDRMIVQNVLLQLVQSVRILSGIFYHKPSLK